MGSLQGRLCVPPNATGATHQTVQHFLHHYLRSLLQSRLKTERLLSYK